MSRFAAIVLLFPAFVSAATTRPATRPATTQSLEQQLAQHKREEQEDFLRQLSVLPETKLPTGTIGDIFEMSLERGMLVVHPKLAGTDTQTRCTVQGFAGPCSVAVFVDKNVPDGPVNAIQFAHRDFSNEQEIFRHTMLFAHAGSVQLSMDLDGLLRSKSVSLIEDTADAPESSVRLSAQMMDAASDELIAQHSLSAPTFSELRRRYPRETQEYVVPILRDLQQQSLLRPDPKIAQQVFQIASKADEPLQKKLDALLPRLDSDRFPERERAAKELSELGAPAALALIQADRKGWSIDRAGAVDSFLAQHKALPPDEIERLRNDPLFLIDCLYSEEAAIRSAAAKSLEKLSQIRIDPDATSAKRDEMIDQLFARLFPAPATAPATQAYPN